MLVNMHVKDLAIIDEVEVDFDEGLNIISGETGAGKSIIIGSINLALGAKVPKDIIRKGADYSLIELVFTVDNNSICGVLEEYGIPMEDNQVIISRKIMPSRSICRINGEVVTGNILKHIASMLINIHGQHENHTLLEKKNHLEILDKYASEEIGDLKDNIREHYKRYSELKAKISEATIDEDKRLREISFLEYSVNEISEAKLVVGEDTELASRYKRLANSRNIAEGMSNVYDDVCGGNSSVTDSISRAIRQLHHISEYDSVIAQYLEQLMDIESLVGDFSKDISAYINSLDNDEEEFIEVEERVDTINNLKNKYGNSIEEILQDCEESQNKLDMLTNHDEYIATLKEELSIEEKALKKYSENLSKIRQKKAIELTHSIAESLVELNFIDVVFEMGFEKLNHFTDNGIDVAEFMISTNPGEAIKPLATVASGGELSRIMLALKSVLADTDAIDTMIFDEIDAGISGRTAQKVSEKLSIIATRRQVICITHLPQIAAMADTHFVIEKTSDMTTTCTNIRKLQKDEAVDEIARIIGGAEITKNVLANAQEMIQLACVLKQSSMI